jgi:hypothetical protein
MRELKRSQAELRRLVEAAVAHWCGLPRRGLWFCVDHVEASGHPLERLKVWATLHYLAAGSPHSDSDPACTLFHFWRLEEIGEHVAKAMGLRQTVSVEFGDRIAVNHHSGVEFNDFRPDSILREWGVFRLEDDGELVLVQSGMTRERAELLVAELKWRGHKQSFWVEHEEHYPAAARRPIRRVVIGAVRLRVD